MRGCSGGGLEKKKQKSDVSSSVGGPARDGRDAKAKAQRREAKAARDRQK